MLSYKAWKQLNESFGFTTLGIKGQQTLGVIGSNDSVYEETKKKNVKKKMLGDEEVPSDEMEDEEDEEDVEDDVAEDDVEADADADAETGDGEVVDPASEKDDPKLAFMKKMKKGMKKMKKEAVSVIGSKEEFMEAMKKKALDKKSVSKEDFFGKKKDEKCSCEQDEWWNSVKSMLGDLPYKQEN